jgi:hypothetical protein
MYRDMSQWLAIRKRVLVDGASRRQVSRETGVSMFVIRKMLRLAEPLPRQGRGRGNWKLGPYIPTIARMVQQTLASPDRPGLSSREVYEHLRSQGYCGCRSAIRDYLRSLKERRRRLWEDAYDRVVSMDDRDAANPKRAGNRIWGQERQRATFSLANNCKDPALH